MATGSLLLGSDRRPLAASRRGAAAEGSGVRVDFSGTLESLAEVGIAITGFAGLVAVIGHRSSQPWTSEDRGNLRALLLWSLGAVFLAYVPIVLSSLGDALRDPWRVSNGVFAAFHAYVFYETFRVTREPNRPRAMNRFEKSLVVTGIAILAGEILAAAGALGSRAASMYLFAVLWFLFLAVTRFAALVAEQFNSPAA